MRYTVPSFRHPNLRVYGYMDHGRLSFSGTHLRYPAPVLSTVTMWLFNLAFALGFTIELFKDPFHYD